MTETKDHALYNSFFHDSDAFILEINRDLIDLEKDPHDGELVNKIFRATHSLKSEADYLNEGDIAAEAHRIESALEAIRSTHGTPTREQFDEFFSCIDRIQEMLGQLKQEKKQEKQKAAEAAPRHGLLNEAERERFDQSPEKKSGSPESLLPDLSDFEKVLLRESLQRGEKFFRISVELDPSTPMPYAKSYLMLNNLEQLIHVVHTAPSFGISQADAEDQSMFLHPLFYCTGDVDETDIYRAINVDLVRSIKISPLEYRSILEGPQREGVSDIYQARFNVQIDGGDLDDLNSYVDELKIRAHRLKRDLLHGNEEVNKQLSILTDLIDNLEVFARKISLVNLKEVLQHHNRLVRDQARKMNKEVQLELKDCEITIDRRAAELISDMVLHLLRNAVVHGIESPVERAKAQKNSKGSIAISAAEENGHLVITVEDDGAGIDEEEIRELAFDRGIKPVNMSDDLGMSPLLAWLVQPGLTTRPAADSHSGRGYGLDLVYRKICQFEGGKLEVQTEPGSGTSFRITLPSGFSVVPLMVIRYNDGMFALPSKYIEREVGGEALLFTAGVKGEMLWEGLNVFTPDGRLYYTDVQPEQQRGLVISYLKHRALLLIDEILFQKEIPEDSMTLYIAGSPYIHRLDLYGAPSDFLYLSPSLVVL